MTNTGAGPRVNLSSMRCAFCHDGVDVDDRAVCAGCLAMHHLECWREHGSCASCSALKVLSFEAEAAKRGKGVAEWVDALADTKDKLRRRLAARALSELGTRAAPAISALRQALSDEDPWVRRWTCVALGELGKVAAAPAIPALRQAAQETDERVAKAAQDALAKLEEAKGKKA